MRFLCGAIAVATMTGCAPPAELPVMPSGQLMAWSDLTGRPLPAPTHVIRLGDEDWRVVDLWLPEGAGPHPVVLMVHGGCWQKAIADRSLMNYAAEELRGRGLAVWNIEYRGVDEDGGGYPGTFLDAARATDALRDHAGAFGLRTDRVVAFGHSAGGHLALWLAARPRLPESSALRVGEPLEIAAVVNSGGLADLVASKPVTPASCLADIMDRLVGEPRPNALSDTSPAEMLPLGVRQVSVSGAQDPISPPVLAHEYTQRASASGDNAEAVIVERSGHVELITPGSEAFRKQTQLLIGLAAVD